MLALPGSGKYPSRNPQQNLADLKAQIAANEKARRSCARWSRSSGWTCQAYMGHVQDNAENRCAA